MLRSPKSLLAPLLTTATLVTLVVGWLGWRFIAQENTVQQQHARERLDNGADAMAAGIRGKLAETGERLSGWLSHPASPVPALDGAVVLAAAADRVEISPRGALPYVPRLAASPPAESALLEAEAAEYGLQTEAALRSYRKLSLHGSPRVRAGALLRLGRVLHKSGNLREALECYRQLAALGDVEAEGYPAELAGLDGQRLTLAKAGDREGERRVAAQLAQYLDGGRWLLTRGTAEYLREEADKSPKPESWLLAEALADLWTEWNGRPPDRGLRVVDAGSRRIIALWRANPEGNIVLAAFAERFLPGLETDLGHQLVDADGKLVAGAASSPPEAVARAIGDWTLRVWPGDKAGAAESGLGPRMLPVMMAAVMLFLWGAVYFMARAIKREGEVARLQSDFVGAVSHEFRSPLTTVRQLSEMLEMGHVPSDERRQKYYQLLSREARRLQRLVETLLNFGKMEAGAQRYRLEELDVAAVVRRVVQELEPQEHETGGRIVASGPEDAVRVLADADALSLAVRNLVDNALKYSPGESPVRVQWGAENGQVSIRVVDQGFGIEPAERETIFHKFVRGQAAAQANVQGTGVGLAMVRHIMTAHGGEVKLETEPGRGSTFTLRLPAAS